jgi:hypothetical protein
MALGPVNTSGLPSLPVETLLQISSDWSGTPVPCPAHIDGILLGSHLDRSEALRALSETCRRLRSVFLAAAWEHLEVCASRTLDASGSSADDLDLFDCSKKLHQELAHQLVWHIKVVSIRNPSLAQYVKFVSFPLVNPTLI